MVSDKDGQYAARDFREQIEQLDGSDEETGYRPEERDIPVRDDDGFDDSGTDDEEDDDSDADHLSMTREQRLDRYYGRFQAHVHPSKAKGLRSVAKKDEATSGGHIFTSSTEVKLMKVEFNVFNGIFYNLDAQEDPLYQYDDINDLYEFFEQLGQGAFSTVFRARFKPLDKIMAVKVLKDEKNNELQQQLTRQEAELIDKLRHKNVVEIHHLIKLKGKFYMGLELLEGGTLHDYLRRVFRKGERLSDTEASRLMSGIMEGVAYVHERGITHRDLKPGNILVKDPNDLSTVKLIDFGLCLNQTKADNYCGTTTYMAPEIVHSRSVYTKSVDLWATGIIMHMVLTGGSHPLALGDRNKSE